MVKPRSWKIGKQQYKILQIEFRNDDGKKCYKFWYLDTKKKQYQYININAVPQHLMKTNNIRAGKKLVIDWISANVKIKSIKSSKKKTKKRKVNEIAPITTGRIKRHKKNEEESSSSEEGGGEEKSTQKESDRARRQRLREAKKKKDQLDKENNENFDENRNLLPDKVTYKDYLVSIQKKYDDLTYKKLPDFTSWMFANTHRTPPQCKYSQNIMIVVHKSHADVDDDDIEEKQQESNAKMESVQTALEEQGFKHCYYSDELTVAILQNWKSKHKKIWLVLPEWILLSEDINVWNKFWMDNINSTKLIIGNSKPLYVEIDTLIEDMFHWNACSNALRKQYFLDFKELGLNYDFFKEVKKVHSEWLNNNNNNKQNEDGNGDNNNNNKQNEDGNGLIASSSVDITKIASVLQVAINDKKNGDKSKPVKNRKRPQEISIQKDNDLLCAAMKIALNLTTNYNDNRDPIIDVFDWCKDYIAKNNNNNNDNNSFKKLMGINNNNNNDENSSKTLKRMFQQQIQPDNDFIGFNVMDYMSTKYMKKWSNIKILNRKFDDIQATDFDLSILEKIKSKTINLSIKQLQDKQQKLVTQKEALMKEVEQKKSNEAQNKLNEAENQIKQCKEQIRKAKQSKEKWEKYDKLINEIKSNAKFHGLCINVLDQRSMWSIYLFKLNWTNDKKKLNGISVFGCYSYYDDKFKQDAKQMGVSVIKSIKSAFEHYDIPLENENITKSHAPLPLLTNRISAAYVFVVRNMFYEYLSSNKNKNDIVQQMVKLIKQNQTTKSVAVLLQLLCTEIKNDIINYCDVEKNIKSVFENHLNQIWKGKPIGDDLLFRMYPNPPIIKESHLCSGGCGRIDKSMARKNKIDVGDFKYRCDGVHTCGNSQCKTLICRECLYIDDSWALDHYNKYCWNHMTADQQRTWRLIEYLKDEKNNPKEHEKKLKSIQEEINNNNNNKNNKKGSDKEEQEEEQKEEPKEKQQT